MKKDATKSGSQRKPRSTASAPKAVPAPMKTKAGSRKTAKRGGAGTCNNLTQPIISPEVNKEDSHETKPTVSGPDGPETVPKVGNEVEKNDNKSKCCEKVDEKAGTEKEKEEEEELDGDEEEGCDWDNYYECDCFNFSFEGKKGDGHEPYDPLYEEYLRVMGAIF